MTIKTQLPDYDKNNSQPIIVETTVVIYDDQHISLSRIIDSKLYVIELVHNKPITVSMVARLSKIDNSLFKELSDS